MLAVVVVSVSIPIMPFTWAGMAKARELLQRQANYFFSSHEASLYHKEWLFFNIFELQGTSVYFYYCYF